MSTIPELRAAWWCFSVFLGMATLFVSTRLVGAQLLPPGSDKLGGAHNIVLIYLDARSLGVANTSDMVLTSTKAEAVVGYRPLLHDDDSNASASIKDTFFDGVVLTGINWKSGKNMWPGIGVDPMDASDWEEILDLWWTMGVKNLNIAAMAVKSALGNNVSSVPVRVFIAVPYPDPRQTNFGDAPHGSSVYHSFSTCNGGPPRSLDFRKLADRILACSCYVRWVVDKFDSEPQDPVLLAGFYWFYEDMPESDQALAVGVANAVHYNKRRFLWIPSWSGGSNGQLESYSDFGFDAATLQPNFCFQNVTSQRFADVNTAIRKSHAGVEMELPLYSKNPQVLDNYTLSFDAYQKAAELYGWSTSSSRCGYGGAVKTYYYGNAFISMAMANVTSPEHSLYHRVHDVACGKGCACKDL